MTHRAYEGGPTRRLCRSTTLVAVLNADQAAAQQLPAVAPPVWDWAAANQRKKKAVQQLTPGDALDNIEARIAVSLTRTTELELGLPSLPGSYRLLHCADAQSSTMQATAATASACRRPPLPCAAARASPRMTRRRGAGFIVIVLGLLAAVVVPIATGRSIPGSAQAVPVPGPPVVGECVGGKFDLGWNVPGTDPAKYQYPGLTLSRCSQAHYGEVVTVIATPTKPKIDVDPSGTSMSIDDKNMDTCYQAAARFLGLNTSDNGFPVLYGYWSFTMSTTVVPMTPTARQRAAGQHWLACSTYLTNQSPLDGTTLVGYQGSLRSAQSTGIGRDYLGYCPTEADWNQTTSIACLQPHHGEIFGSGGLSRSVARTTLTVSCAKLVAQVTKSAALTRDTRFAVAVQATDVNGNILNGPTIPANAGVQCGLLTTSGRLLKGGLIAIGSNPIPWA